MLLSMFLVVTGPVSVSSDDEVAFVLGFRTLADLIPDVVGTPLENEHHNPINGDGLQMTSTGLMVWRKADNWTAFTNGWWTWVNGPYGLQDRPNEMRFGWELETLLAAPTSAPTEAFATAVSSASQRAAPSAPTAFPATSTPTASPVPSPIPTFTPTPTPRPSATPRATRTAVPTHTAVPTQTPKPTPTPLPPGIMSAEPAGEWVTSVSEGEPYYCSRGDDACWQGWASRNRIWFDTEAELLEAYPGRVKKY